MTEHTTSRYCELVTLWMILMVTVLTAGTAAALTIVDNGKAVATIVLPEQPG